MKLCKRFVITGRVQGVFYRQGTFEQAEKLNLTGWVRNLNNGAVECLACGESDAIESLARWLEAGPPAAKVTGVTSEALPWEDVYQNFKVQR